MHASTGSAPVLMPTFSLRTGCPSWRPELNLHEVCVLQPGWLAVQRVEASTHFWDSSWPKAGGDFVAVGLGEQSARRRLKACCGLDVGACQAGWTHALC